MAVEVRGYDTLDPATGNAAEGGPDDVACWMLDTDHDGESFYARRGARRELGNPKVRGSWLGQCETRNA